MFPITERWMSLNQGKNLNAGSALIVNPHINVFPFGKNTCIS
ncbi:MAG: hypothetical protein ACYCSW_05110 [bacterium]